MGTYIDPFNFGKVFLDYFLGGTNLFLFAFIILTSAAAAKFQLKDKVFIPLLVVGALIFSTFVGEAVYALIIILVGLAVYKGVSKIVQ